MLPLKRIGDWQIDGRPLGKGGNGIVFPVTRASELGALKISNSKDPKRWRRFSDEIAAMKRCADIPGVLPILDRGQHADGKPWFVMGRAVPLLNKLGTNPTLQASVEAISDIAHTLALVHARGVSHRDVKPENLFHFDGLWAVGDFGLAHFEGKVYVTQARERIGPVLYIAPEMLNEAAISDGRAADVYSLAKTLWVLATGQTYPLPGEYVDTSLPFRISSYLSADRTEALDALVRASTRFDPKARPSMERFAAELTEWLAPIPVSRAPISLSIEHFAAELERQRTLLDANQKHQQRLTESREKHGRRIRDALRPLANDVAQTLNEARLHDVRINIENVSFGFELSAHVPRAPNSGARLVLQVFISVDDQDVQVTADYKTYPIRSPGGLSMTIWDKKVSFLAEGSQETYMLSVLDAAVREQLQRAVEVVIRLALTDEPGAVPSVVPGGVTVRSPDSLLANAMVTLLLPNGLYMECATNPEGKATFNNFPATTNLKAFASHPNYAGMVLDSSPLHGWITMPGKPGISGSLVAKSGWTEVKGLAGSVNFIHDEQDRRYVYAQKMAINGNSGGPATVDLGSPLSITDVNGKTVTLVPIAFHGECFLLDILEEPKNGPTAISKLYYLAYGSNLHPVRLREKGRAPSAKLIGVVELAGKSINFYKRSDDKSGKCDLVDSPGSTAYAALYEIPSTEKEALDKVEAVGRGYSEIPIRVSVNSVSYAAFTYIADPKHIVSDLSPYDWYKEMVIAGAKFHRFPSAYIELLKGTPSISDPNKERAAKREILVSKLTTPTSEE